MNKTTWPMELREDGIRMEILCPCGVGHPSKTLSNRERWKSWMSIHGCCSKGCCAKPEYYLAEVEHKIHQLRTSHD